MVDGGYSGRGGKADKSEYIWVSGENRLLHILKGSCRPRVQTNLKGAKEGQAFRRNI